MHGCIHTVSSILRAADNVTLLAFVAEPAVQQSIAISWPPGQQQQSHCIAKRVCGFFFKLANIWQGYKKERVLHFECLATTLLEDEERLKSA